MRIFKTSHFCKLAAKAEITEKELCEAAKELEAGQGTDLGGNVFKKRLNENRHRSIVITKTARFWIYTFLFAKADRENISDKELRGFKKLATDYGKVTDEALRVLVEYSELVEICHDCKKV